MSDTFKIKLGIYMCALLRMGVISTSSIIALLVVAFPQSDSTTIAFYLSSIPCLVIIPVTLITGKLVNYYAKKTLMIIGTIFWLIGGVGPYFMHSLEAIAVMRFIFGIGVGMVQTLCVTLVVENFDDKYERNRTMGNVTAFQMIGCIIFSLGAGYLGGFSWNAAFLVHLVGFIGLLGAILFLPYKQPIGKTGVTPKFKPTLEMWVWCIAFLVYMIGGQAFANNASHIITQQGLGDSVAAGFSLAFFAIGGGTTGFGFAKFANCFKNMTLTAGALISTVGYLIVVFAPTLAVLYIGAFVFGFALTVCIPCIMNGAAASVDSDSSGMAVSLSTCLQNVGMAICPYAVAPIGVGIAASSQFSIAQGTMLGAAAIMFIVAVAFGIFNHKKA